VGNGDHQPSKGAAASAGKGSKTTVELEKGQVLTLLVSDGTDWYADNEGSVQVGITAEIVLPPEETPVETPEDS
jgi:hypothetical protein